MFALIRWAFLCFLAVLAGVAAVSIPLGEKTLAERLRDLAEGAEVERVAAEAAKKALARIAEEEPLPSDEITDEDRKALERLIGERTGAR